MTSKLFENTKQCLINQIQNCKTNRELEETVNDAWLELCTEDPQ